MNRIKTACMLYRIYRQCNPPLMAARMAWLGSKD